MITRTFAGMPPTITFTLDLHELLNGDLRPHTTLNIRYDPSRIVPEGEPYLFGDPNKPILVHAKFSKDGDTISVPLVSEGGVLHHPVVDVTGGGSMLTARIAVPGDAEVVVVWFTYESPESGLHLDANNGQNFWFPFVSEQIKVVLADVITDREAGRSEFSLKVAAIPAVERIAVRVQPTSGEPIEPDPELNKTQEKDAAGWTIWELRVPVPFEAIVSFKLFYWVKGIRYKDDNSTRYYLAPRPPTEILPPVPQELVDVLSSGKWRDI